MFGLRGGWFATTAAAQLVTAAAGMATNVIYARTLELADFGVVAIANAVALYVSVLGDRGFSIWATRALAIGDITPAQTVRVAARLGAPVAFISLTFMGIVVIWFENASASVAVLSVSLALTMWLFQLSLTVAQGVDRTSARSLAVCGNGILTLAASWIGMLVYPTAWVAVAVSGATYIVAGWWLLGRCRVRVGDVVTHEPDLSSKKIGRDCTPLFATTAANHGVVASDLLLASAFLTPAMVARFQIAKKIGQSTSLPLVATNAVLLGRLVRMEVMLRSRTVMKAGVGSWIVVMGAIFASSVAAEPVISTVFGPDFSGLSDVVVLVIAAYYFQYLKDLLAAALNAAGHDRAPLVVNVCILLTIGAYALIDRPESIFDVACMFLASVSVGSVLSILYCSVKSILQARHSLAFLAILSVTVSFSGLLLQ